MGGLKFEKPVKVEISTEAVFKSVEIPKLDLHLNLKEADGKIVPGPIPEEQAMRVIPDLGQTPAARYSGEWGLVRVSTGEVPLFLQKYQNDLAVSAKNLEGWNESLVVYLQTDRIVSGAKKGLLSFLGFDLFLKFCFGEFLAGSFAFGVLSYFMVLGAYLGWVFTKNQTSLPLPEARLLEAGKNPEK